MSKLGTAQVRTTNEELDARRRSTSSTISHPRIQYSMVVSQRARAAGPANACSATRRLPEWSTVTSSINASPSLPAPPLLILTAFPIRRSLCEEHKSRCYSSSASEENHPFDGAKVHEGRAVLRPQRERRRRIVPVL